MPRRKRDPNGPPPQSAATKVADQLRQHIIGVPEGTFLGNENDLLERFGISRPTFRQSVRLLEMEQILEVRRGPDGGYYARKPSMSVIGRIAASYLESHCTSPEQWIDASFAALRAMIRRAARSEDASARAEMRAFSEKLAATDVKSLSPEEFHRINQTSRVLVSRLADNPALELVIEMLYQAAMDERGPGPLTFDLQPRRRGEWKQLHLRLWEAVLNREADVASAISDRLQQQLLAWRSEDCA